MESFSPICCKVLTIYLYIFKRFIWIGSIQMYLQRYFAISTRARYIILLGKTYMLKISISTTFIKIRSAGFILIQILESHQKYDENIDLLSGVFLAADMFQMIDLEAAVLQRLSKCCTPNNCLSLYLLVQNLESLASFASLEVSNAKEEVCM